VILTLEEQQRVGSKTKERKAAVFSTWGLVRDDMRHGIIQAPQVLPIAIRIGGAGTDQYQAAMQEPKFCIYKFMQELLPG
jgi:hypothetical protein